jgi:hypothetical protein
MEEEEEEVLKLLDKLKNQPLTGGQLQKICPGNIVLIRDLHLYKDIDDLLGPDLHVYLLYESEPHSGHWCALTRNDNLVEFFDPYGEKPDDQLKYIPPNFAKKTKQDQKLLSHLLVDCKYDISYNEFSFQRFDKDTSTCGRWSAMRCLLKKMPLEDFNYLFLTDYENGGSDYIISLLTS